MNIEMQKRALAAREAHIALLDLKKIVDDAAQTTHAVELEAVHLALSLRPAGDISAKLRVVKDRLEPANFDAALSRVRESLQLAMS